jgi:hypothetical protein
VWIFLRYFGRAASRALRARVGLCAPSPARRALRALVSGWFRCYPSRLRHFVARQGSKYRRFAGLLNSKYVIIKPYPRPFPLKRERVKRRLFFLIINYLYLMFPFPFSRERARDRVYNSCTKIYQFNPRCGAAARGIVAEPP